MKHGRLFLCVAVVMAVSAVRADSYSWLLSSGTASFQDSMNWNPNGVPGASDSATFGTAGTYGVTFAADAQNSGATVGSAGGTDATFGLGGRAWLLGNLTFTGSVAAHFGGGTLKVNGTPSMGANQRLTLESGACSFVGLALSNPGGSVEVYGGDHSVSNGVSLYPTVSGGPGLRITNGTFWVQAQNNTRLVLNNGTGGGSVVNVEGGTIKVGNLDIYQGAINVYTNGTYLTATANIGRGNRYAGAVNIFGGTVSNYMGSNVGLGMAAWNSTSPATGIVNLVDGVLYNSSGINLGGSPTDDRTTNSVGILNVEGGWLYAPTLTLGRHTGTLGVYTQSAGQAWCSNLLLGNGGTGARGEVYLSGGTLALASYPYLGNAATCTGRLYQTGGNLMISNSVVVGGAMGASGFFRQEGGTLQLNGSLYVGNATNAYGFYEYDGGSATINGSVRIGNVAGAFGKVLLKGSSLYVRDDWLIGAAASATGELEIADGTLVRPGDLSVGPIAGCVGRLRVTGGNMVVSNALNVGTARGALGELTLESGSITALDSGMGIQVGTAVYATGVLHVAGGTLMATNRYALFASTVTGAYGRVVFSGGTNDFRSGRIGHNGGTGLLRVEGGCTYFTNTPNNCLTIGNMESSTGRLEIAGGLLSVLTIASWGSAWGDVLFDGGTLRRGASGNEANFVGGLDLATLTDRGAVIDSNGSSLGIPQALSDEPGYAGRFTKKGPER